MEGVVFSGERNDHLRTAPPPDGGGGSQGRRISFRDKLLGCDEPLPKREVVDLIEKELFSIVLEKDDRLRPKCFIDDKLLEELRGGLCLAPGSFVSCRIRGSSSPLQAMWHLLAHRKKLPQHVGKC